MIKKACSALAACLIAASGVFSASAQEELPAYCQPGDLVAYHNGMLSQHFNSRFVLHFLKNDVVRSVADEETADRVRFELFYNPTSGFLSDLNEASAQIRFLEVLRLYREYLAGEEVNQEGLDFEELASGYLGGLLDAAVDLSTVIEHARRYETAIGRGERIFSFAHSQGNIYFNVVSSQLSATELNAVGVVALASPAPDRGAQGGHVTLSGGIFNHDRVIAGLRLLGFDTLAPNINNGSPGGDSLNHGIIESYLLPDSNSLAEVRRIFGNLLNSLSNEGEFGAGAISVTLNWDEQPDVDLHVFEPNGTQVFYANRLGQSGELDRDDVDGFGPENYFVPCENLEFGMYSVGINYFRGDGPTDATVDVEGGDEAIQVTRRLFEARGSAGNSNPIPIADIEVREGETASSDPVFIITRRS